MTPPTVLLFVQCGLRRKEITAVHQSERREREKVVPKKKRMRLLWWMNVLSLCILVRLNQVRRSSIKDCESVLLLPHVIIHQLKVFIRTYSSHGMCKQKGKALVCATAMERKDGYNSHGFSVLTMYSIGYVYVVVETELFYEVAWTVYALASAYKRSGIGWYPYTGILLARPKQTASAKLYNATKKGYSSSKLIRRASQAPPGEERAGRSSTHEEQHGELPPEGPPPAVEMYDVDGQEERGGEEMDAEMEEGSSGVEQEQPQIAEERTSEQDATTAESEGSHQDSSHEDRSKQDE
jgi:hypothetical protein